MNDRRPRTDDSPRLRVQHHASHGDPFACGKPRVARNCRKSCPARVVPDPLREAADKLQTHLDQALAAGQTIPASDLASFVSALALAKLALAERQDSASNASKVESTEMPVTHGMPIAESVVDYPADEIKTENDTRATDDFLWRRELESLWRKHITKDEFHRPVVRSLGLPVLVIVDHVRSGRSWKSICENYPGLVSDDIRAAVSMATECGWLSED